MIGHNHFDDQIMSKLLMKSTSRPNGPVTDEMGQWRMRWDSDGWDGTVTDKVTDKVTDRFWYTSNDYEDLGDGIFLKDTWREEDAIHK